MYRIKPYTLELLYVSRILCLPIYSLDVKFKNKYKYYTI